jgi:hypothetical protein
MVTSRDVQEVVSKLSSDKAKAREVTVSLSTLFDFPENETKNRNETKLKIEMKL